MAKTLTPAEAARLIGVSRQAIEDAMKRNDRNPGSGLPHTSREITTVEKRIKRADALAYRRKTGGEPGRPSAGTGISKRCSFQPPRP